MSTQSIASILEDMNAAYAGTSEKTANVTETSQPESLAAARQRLETSLYDLTSGRSKTAAQNGDGSAQYLTKVAQDLAQMDMAATIKEAHVFGAAVFDGFISRANAYGNAGGATKTASYAQMEKIAAEEDMRGVRDALIKVAAASEDCFSRGFQHVQQLLR